jgi:hypothetical protein
MENFKSLIYFLKSGESMDFLADLFSNLNFEVILQLTSVSLILIAGPVVVFILYALRGDL